MKKNLLPIIFLMSSTFVLAETPSMYDLTNFATSPDKKLKLWTQTTCPDNKMCQVYYQKGNKLIKVMDLTPPSTDIPNVEWYGNIANISIISGTDATLDVFIDAKHGVFKVANMTQFDPKHECALGLDETGNNIAFYRLYQNRPKTVINSDKMDFDESFYFPITTVAIGGENGFLENGDFKLNYFTNQNQQAKTIIKNPCQ